MSDFFDTVWTEILSRQAARIKTAYGSLSAEEQQKVSTHLEKMTREDGWHPEQVISAQAALEAIRDE